MRFLGAVVVFLVLAIVPSMFFLETIESMRIYAAQSPLQLNDKGFFTLFGAANAIFALIVVRVWWAIGNLMQTTRKTEMSVSVTDDEETPSIHDATTLFSERLSKAVSFNDYNSHESEMGEAVGPLVADMQAKIGADEYAEALQAIARLEGELMKWSYAANKFSVLEALHTVRGAVYDTMEEIRAEEKRAAIAAEAEEQRQKQAEAMRRHAEANRPTPRQAVLKANKDYVQALTAALSWEQNETNGDAEDFLAFFSEHVPALQRSVANGRYKEAFELLATLESRVYEWSQACDENGVLDAASDLREALSEFLLLDGEAAEEPAETAVEVAAEIAAPANADAT